jgi:hypothetical protein
MTPEQRMLWEFLQREGPMSIGIMKEMTGLKVKEITPILHRLQQAFLLFEDQEDSEGDRSWYIFGQEFSEASFLRYTRQQALCEIIPRLIYRNVWMDRDMLHSFLCLPPKEIEPAIQELIEAGVIHSCDLNNKEGFVLCQDMDQQEIEPARSVFALHRNDFLVKCNEAWLKKTFDAAPYEELYYLLVDGRFAGIAAGKFHNGPFDVEDIRLSLAMDEGAVRKEEILAAMEKVCDPLLSPVKRYQGLPL